MKPQDSNASHAVATSSRPTSGGHVGAREAFDVASFNWNDFLSAESLPASYRVTAERWFLPLIQDVARQTEGRDSPLIVGVNGSQGSGKSTLGNLMCGVLEQCAGLTVVTLSLDDFYLTREQREALAETVHPLLATRGVPGTHDAPLMLDVLGKLVSDERPVALPRFDKAADDRTDAAQWHQVGASVDVIIFDVINLIILPLAWCNQNFDISEGSMLLDLSWSVIKDATNGQTSLNTPLPF